MWLEFFDIQAAFQQWLEAYEQMAASAAEGAQPSQQDVALLAEQAQAALRAGLGFLRARRLDSIVADSQVPSYSSSRQDHPSTGSLQAQLGVSM